MHAREELLLHFEVSEGECDHLLKKRTSCLTRGSPSVDKSFFLLLLWESRVQSGYLIEEGNLNEWAFCLSCNVATRQVSSFTEPLGVLDGYRCEAPGISEM